MKIELRRCGPGRGLLRVDGRFDAPESVALAVQRNDGRYLGVAQQWQTTPHWYPQFAVQPDGDALLVELGPDIVDGIIGVGGSPLRCLLRVDGIEDLGVLRIKGELIGSGAAATSESTGDEHDTVVVSAPRDANGADPLAVETEADTDTVSARIDPPRRSRVAAWLVLALLFAVFAVVGGGWYLGLLDGWLGAAQTESGVESIPQATSEPSSMQTPVPGPQSGEEPIRAPGLNGVALARSILDGGPEPDIVYARAEQAEQQQDCAAALVLFNAAADAGPRFAAALARRYDPQTFVAGGCIDQPDAPYAIVFFTDAAQAGDVVAQRRLGQLMTERERSGATYEEGLDWLRKAAASGDEEAVRILAEIGE